MSPPSSSLAEESSPTQEPAPRQKRPAASQRDARGIARTIESSSVSMAVSLRVRDQVAVDVLHVDGELRRAAVPGLLERGERLSCGARFSPVDGDLGLDETDPDRRSRLGLAQLAH